MRFLIITSFGVTEIEAEDFRDAVDQSYNNHTGYRNVYAIVKAEEEGNAEPETSQGEDTGNAEIVYFELNNWFSGRDYPEVEPIASWVNSFQFSREEWVKENELCVVAGPIDMSANWCITAKKEWVLENFPELLSNESYTYTIIRHFQGKDERIEETGRYSDFLRYPEDEGDHVYGRFDWRFLDYCKENIGIEWNHEDLSDEEDENEEDD